MACAERLAETRCDGPASRACSIVLTKIARLLPRTGLLKLGQMSKLRAPVKAKRKAAASRFQTWGAMLIGKPSQFLGDVEAPDRAGAEVAAVRVFNLSKEQRKRLLVRERG